MVLLDDSVHVVLESCKHGFVNRVVSTVPQLEMMRSALDHPRLNWVRVDLYDSVEQLIPVWNREKMGRGRRSK